MAEQRFTVTIQPLGQEPVLTHTNFRHAAMLRFCRAVMASSGWTTTVTVTDHGDEDRIVASATFTPSRSHRVTGQTDKEPTNE